MTAAKGTLRAEGFQRRLVDLAGWAARLTSYALGGRHVAKVDNVDPGATVARAEAGSREEAEERALERARARLAASRRRRVG